MDKGVYRAICDRCGFKFWNYQLQKTWDGLMVDDDCFEERHQQDFIKVHSDVTRLPFTLPVPATVEVSVTYDTDVDRCSVLGVYSHAGFAEADCWEAGIFHNDLEGV